MSDWIRVRFKDTKTEQSIPTPAALDEGAYTVLKEDATDSNGRVLPPKFPAQNSTGQKAATSKES